jgi:hypothetical protein
MSKDQYNPSGEQVPAGVITRFTLAEPKIEPKFWLLNIILALVLPPIGLLVGFFSLLKAFRFKKRIYLFLALVLTVFSIFGAFVYYNLLTGKFYHQKYSYQNSSIKLEDYVVRGSLKGRSLAFKKPQDFTNYSTNSTPSAKISTFVKMDNSRKYSLAIITASTTSSALAPDKNYIDSLHRVFNKSEGEDYKAVKEPLEKFVKDSVGASFYNVVLLQKPETFTNRYIRENAWRFNFTLKSQNDSGAKRAIADQKGVLIFAIGKASIYYFMISTLDFNWQPNYATWQNILDSIKIDQP